jgi:hypothetical protein
MHNHEPGTPMTESRRQEVFLALVTAQDQEMSVSQSRKHVAEQFAITENQVMQIEREGIDNNWPPLDAEAAE